MVYIKFRRKKGSCLGLPDLVVDEVYQQLFFALLAAAYKLQFLLVGLDMVYFKGVFSGKSNFLVP
jgi:hypothetical protein